ncbi:MAG: YveK family protein, partial [Acidimicrobiales bacterium]
MPGTGDEGSEAPLREYLRVVRRRKVVIAACVAVAVAVALLLSLFQTPVYEAVAEVLLQPRNSETIFDTTQGRVTDPARDVQTQIHILQSAPVRAAVRAQLGSASPVQASPAGQTDIIEVSSRSTNAKRAADTANSYAHAYIDLRQKQAVNDALAAAQQIQGKIGDLQKQIDGFESQISSAPAAQQNAVRESITPQRDAVVQQQGVFKSQLDKLQVDAALQSGGAQLSSEASTPTQPVAPRPLRSGALAGVVGFLAGVGLAFFVDYLDDSVKTKDDLARVAPSVPVIGLIPAIAGWKVAEDPQVVSLDDPRAPASEAYRTLRTSIQFLALEQPMRTLQVTSASAQEGKTTTLVNLAVALARAGQRVI